MKEDDIIEGEKIASLCDYSFGDQSGIVSNTINKNIEPILNNENFINVYNKAKRENRKYITLFVDNIRLYKRKFLVKKEDEEWINTLYQDIDLFTLCKKYGDLNYIIFCNLEDTPIDDVIHNCMQSNVLAVYAANCISYKNNVYPFPYGIQRKMGAYENKKKVLADHILKEIHPEKLLYINHNISTNPRERNGIYEIFEHEHWATLEKSRIPYNIFLKNIKKHQFMICPIGNAVDCHRNWEVLYMKRVPIMKKNKYLEKLFENFPVLFVEKYEDVNEDLLKQNEFLYIKAQGMDMNQLNINLMYKKILSIYDNN